MKRSFRSSILIEYRRVLTEFYHHDSQQLAYVYAVHVNLNCNGIRLLGKIRALCVQVLCRLKRNCMWPHDKFRCICNCKRSSNLHLLCWYITESVHSTHRICTFMRLLKHMGSTHVHFIFTRQILSQNSFSFRIHIIFMGPFDIRGPHNVPLKAWRYRIQTGEGYKINCSAASCLNYHWNIHVCNRRENLIARTTALRIPSDLSSCALCASIRATRVLVRRCYEQVATVIPLFRRLYRFFIRSSQPNQADFLKSANSIAWERDPLLRT